MDPRRFDQWTQTLARRLDHDARTELDTPAEPAGRAAPRADGGSGTARGTCLYPDLATPGSGSVAGICGWDGPSVPVSTSGVRPAEHTGRSASRRRTQPLSPREQEIAALIGQGLRNREIAAMLVLSERTVHAYVRTLLDKLGLTSRAQIAVWGSEHGLLQSPQRSQAGLSSERAAQTEQ